MVRAGGQTLKGEKRTAQSYRRPMSFCDITYVPLACGFMYLAALMDW